jgi:mono/diheme cytochrome c family protein
MIGALRPRQVELDRVLPARPAPDETLIRPAAGFPSARRLICRLVNRAPRTALIIAIAALAAVAAGCGDGREVDSRGAELFADRCGGCHTLAAAGTEGSNPEQRVAGPNLNARRETKDQVLYAIRNGGFSGAIMPQNIVVGEDAEAVAEFVAEYAGQDATEPPGLSRGDTSGSNESSSGQK